jgi:hypothetical protein
VVADAGVQGEDSGTLGCHKLHAPTATMTTNNDDGENPSAYAQLKVLGEVLLHGFVFLFERGAKQ